MLADFWESYVQRKKIQIVLGMFIFFVVSMVMSCQEMRYMISGKTVDATVERNQVEKTSGRHGEMVRRMVSYSFMDKDTFRREYAEVPMDWGESKTVKVQYLPGSERSARIYGERNLAWVVIFFVSVAVMVAGLVWMARER